MDPVQPEDIAVLIAFAAREGAGERVPSLLSSWMTHDQVQASLARLQKARLFMPHGQRVARPVLARLLTYGVPFLFPASFVGHGVGLRTAWSHPRVISGMGLFVPEHQHVVWPLALRAGWTGDPGDTLSGQLLEPLAPWVSALAGMDEEFYWRMSLVECLRAGRARERAWASQQLGLLWGNAA